MGALTELAGQRYREQTGPIMYEISKRGLLITLVVVLIGVGITVEITYYVAPAVLCCSARL